MYYINFHVKGRKKTKKKLRTAVNRTEFLKWGLQKAMQKHQAVRRPFRQIPNLSQKITHFKPASDLIQRHCQYHRETANMYAAACIFAS